MSGYPERVEYTIYDPATDEVLASGTASQCAAKLGCRRDYVYELISKIKSGRIKGYVLVKDDPMSGEVEVYGEDNVLHNRQALGKKIAEYHALGYNDDEIAFRAGVPKKKVQRWRWYHKAPSNQSVGRPRRAVV